jgi:hypothetical protein
VGTPAPAAPPSAADLSPSTPQDDDERFIVGLVLTYYRRHPQRARGRLLDLLGEVLTPSNTPAAPTAPRTPAPAPSPAQESSAWQQVAVGIAPLKGKKR